ncbi:MAG TPA: aldo/keto reductase [Rhodanobacteraceae bacterium]|jgi:aryl-alcohol dehydrogenase-like predicted oxidoreductase|nr:aldo/keto reductase [Rhodanobacteraceae bacterium]
MSKRALGNSGIAIEPLALGGNVFGWSADEPASFAVLDAFVAEGLNFIDTADTYSGWVPGNQGGESETIIGRWLKRSGKRDQVVIATKVAKWSRHRGLSAANIAAAADESLDRLGIDCIDVYFAHEDDPSVPLEETLGAFARLIEAGKVRSIGASNYGAARLAAALDVSAKHGLPRYEVLEPEYNLVSRKGYENELEPLVRRENIGVVSYYALASGFLTGKYRDKADLSKSAARGGAVAKYLNPVGLRILGALDDVASAHRATPAQVALAWLMARPGITAPIASATNAAQVHDIAAATRLSLSAPEIAALDQASRD